MPKPSDYFLSDADNAAIFEQQILPAEFGTVAQEPEVTAAISNGRRPVCIILAGQTGAGKSHAAPALAAALSKLAPSAGTSYCHLVADTHKPYHPAYTGLVADATAGRGPPGLASAATGHDARRWLARACAVAASRGLPTLVESASRYPQDVVDMAGIFHDHNYRVCLVLLSVHPVQSRLGLLARFLDAKAAPAPMENVAGDVKTTTKKAMPVRLTPRRIHDESYVGLVELAEKLDAQTSTSPLADAVLILRRGNQVAYTNYWIKSGDGDKQRQWQTLPAGVSSSLSTEREKRQLDKDDSAESSPLAAESQLFSSDVERLRAAHPGRAIELDALASEYAATTPQETETGPTFYHLLGPDALVAHLQSDW
ncbi:hypothetical protein Sste5346_002450 [Sporothrix stenoceras]|uniref:Zeta toxin domain-containing protein n=1 Tax=Sporothrix stenoceras TaxID=5173 RepID=A0ABR3ZIA1_9PEZI